MFLNAKKVFRMTQKMLVCLRHIVSQQKVQSDDRSTVSLSKEVWYIYLVPLAIEDSLGLLNMS